jgi:hypothetical protein
MRSLRARLDKLTRELGMGEAWEGCDLRDALEFGLFGKAEDDDGPEMGEAPAGIQRFAFAAGLAVAVDTILHPDPDKDRNNEAAEYREALGVAEGATRDEVIGRALEIAGEEGFNAAELAWLRDAIGGPPQRLHAGGRRRPGRGAGPGGDGRAGGCC